MVAKKKPGPHPEHPKDTMVRVRMDKITLAALDHCVQRYKTTRSDIIRRGIFKMQEDLDK